MVDAADTFADDVVYNSNLVGASAARESSLDGFAFVYGEARLSAVRVLQDEDALLSRSGEHDIAIRGGGPVQSAVVGGLLIDSVDCIEGTDGEGGEGDNQRNAQDGGDGALRVDRHDPFRIRFLLKTHTVFYQAQPRPPSKAFPNGWQGNFWWGPVGEKSPLRALNSSSKDIFRGGDCF